LQTIFIEGNDNVMADLEKKLVNFSHMILSEAEQKKEQIISDLNKQQEAAVNQKETEILAEAYEDIQKAIARFARENNERVMKFEMTRRKEVILVREKIIEQIFEEVQNRLAEFVSTPEYIDWLLNTTQKAIDEIGCGDIRVTEEDLKYKDAILARFEGCTVSQMDETDSIGGVIVYNNNIFVDYTIREMLAEQHKEFLKTSGLSIKA